MKAIFTEKGFDRGSSPWGQAARWFWIACATCALVLLILSPAPRYRQVQLITQEPFDSKGLLTLQDVQQLEALGLSLKFYAGYFTTLEMSVSLAHFSIGLVIFWKRGKERLPWVLSLGLVLLGLYSSPLTSALEGSQLAAFLLIGLRNLGMGCLVWSFLTFPDGSHRPPWTRYLSSIWFGYLAISLFIPAIRIEASIVSQDRTSNILILMFAALLSVIVAVQLQRYRNDASPIQRQQTKWVMYGFVIGPGLITATALPFLLLSQFIFSGTMLLLVRLVAFTIILLAFLLLALSFAAAILYSRLWDLDFLIRRTVSYALLTGVLVLVYFSGVVLLQTLFRALTGQSDSPLITVVSTLAIAALFNPLRNRIQDFIDRRFYRRKYDAEQTLARFSTTVRDEVDLENLAAAMLGAVRETLQPEQVELRLREAQLFQKVERPPLRRWK